MVFVLWNGGFEDSGGCEAISLSPCWRPRQQEQIIKNQRWRGRQHEQPLSI